MGTPILLTEDPASAPAPQAHGLTLLIVDDDPFMRALLCDILEPEGYPIASAASASDAIAIIAAGGVGVIVCDQCMPLTPGTAFFERARQLAPACYRIMLTAMDDDAVLRRAEQRGDIERRLGKPFDGAVLRAAVADGFRIATRRMRALAAPTFKEEPRWPKN
ncbi:response regulator [Massilia sp. PWRC2]|uniref:response regulator n=1 Tax=Massilia sp. PWRC2 TaxID=2804626 RepID=UPI003CF31A0F